MRVRRLTALESVWEKYDKLVNDGAQMSDQEELHACKVIQYLLKRKIIEPCTFNRSKDYAKAFVVRDAESGEFEMYIDYRKFAPILKNDEGAFQIPSQQEIEKFQANKEWFAQGNFRILSPVIAFPFLLSNQHIRNSEFCVLEEYDSVFKFLQVPFDFPGGDLSMHRLLCVDFLHFASNASIMESYHSSCFKLGRSYLLVCVDRLYFAAKSPEDYMQDIRILLEFVAKRRLSFDPDSCKFYGNIK